MKKNLNTKLLISTAFFVAVIALLTLLAQPFSNHSHDKAIIDVKITMLESSDYAALEIHLEGMAPHGLIMEGEGELAPNKLDAVMKAIEFDTYKKKKNGNLKLYADTNHDNIFNNEDKLVKMFNKNKDKLVTDTNIRTKMKNLQIDYYNERYKEFNENNGKKWQLEGPSEKYYLFLVPEDPEKRVSDIIDLSKDPKFTFINMLNKESEVLTSFRYVDLLEVEKMKEKAFTKEEFLEKYDLFTENEAGEIIFKELENTIEETIIIPYGLTLRLMPGTILKLKKDVSILSYSKVLAEGTKDAPITVTAKDRKKPFRVFGVIDEEADGSRFTHFHISHGYETHIQGIYMSGMLSIYHADVEIADSIFAYAHADDGLNLKYSNSTVTNSLFFRNAGDAIDFDFLDGSITDSYFLENGNDSIDLSGSDILISNNIIEASGDKCISIGEKSNPRVSNNILDNCNIGIEVKDSSDPIITNVAIINNNTGINAYQKKEHFGSAKGTISNALIAGNTEDLTYKNDFKGEKLWTDESEVTILNSLMEEESDGSYSKGGFGIHTPIISPLKNNIETLIEIVGDTKTPIFEK